MPYRIASLLVAIVFLPITAAAATFPATFTLDPGLSHLNISLGTNFGELGNTDVPLVVGWAEADIEQTGILPPALNFTNVVGGIVLDDATVNTILGDFIASGITSDLGLGTGPYPGNGSNPGTIDLGGLPLTIPSGTITVGEATIIADFGATPLITSLLSPTLVTFEETLGPPSYALSLAIPVSVEETTVVPELGDLELVFMATGSLVFSGEMLVPEPSALCLGTLSLVGFMAMAYRRGRRSPERTIV